jgi:hypothetical protein
MDNTSRVKALAKLLESSPTVCRVYSNPAEGAWELAHLFVTAEANLEALLEASRRIERSDGRPLDNIDEDFFDFGDLVRTFLVAINSCKFYEYLGIVGPGDFS